MIFFKFPFNDTIYTTDENTDEKLVSFHAFDGDETVGFKGNIIPVSKEDILKDEIFTDSVSYESDAEGETEQEYLEKLQKVIGFIKENKLRKLVIARRKKAEFGKVSLSKTFLNLSKTYPNAFAYLFISENECWIGAFSELLGKFNKTTGEFETMSLAGTLPVDEQWSEKEIHEQKAVTDYIYEILLRYSEFVQQSETYDHPSGNIKHLRTDFKATVKAPQLEKVISELHPTPAVCGFPKDFCKNAINNFEKYPREFYAGYSKIEMGNEVYFFVNLRCAKIYRNHADIFVGGGITAESSPEKEWHETELKSQAITKNLATL